MAALGSHDEGYSERFARAASGAWAGSFAVVWLAAVVGFLYLLFR